MFRRRRRKFVEENRGDTEGVGYIKTRSEARRAEQRLLRFIKRNEEKKL